MGIYEDNTQLLGLRILTCNADDNAFYTKHEFTGLNWKQRALEIIPNYIGKTGVLIQTLHRVSYSLDNGHGTIWLNNQNINLEDLY
jgi:hypothetical protein